MTDEYNILEELRYAIECERQNRTPEDCGLMKAMTGAVTEIENLRQRIATIRDEMK